MRRLLLLGACLLGLAGCLGSAPPVPRDHFYRILVPSPPRSHAALFPGVLSVAPLEADGLLRERPLLYSATGAAHEMQQHDYHYWIDPPPRMLQGQLVDYLRASGLAGSVVTPELRIAADYELIGRVKRLERLLGAGQPRVVVELELSLVAATGDRILVIETYSAEEPATDESIEASVVALQTALSEIFERFLDDAAWSRAAAQPGAG